MNEIVERYVEFVLATTKGGTGALSSYLTAIKMLNRVLPVHTKFLRNGETVWDIRDIDKLEKIRLFINQEKGKDNFGAFSEEKSKSYIEKGWCFSAISKLISLLPLLDREEQMMMEIKTLKDPKEFTKRLEAIELQEEDVLITEIKPKEGKDVVRELKVRQNQNVFRKMILEHYQTRCCLSGLSIPPVLRASHISPWAEDETNRLNPENGLCLSATYDAAFDRYLISFDEDYRLILSPALKEFYQDEAFKRDFKELEGKRIEMPIRFKPSQTLLQKHRERLVE